MICLLVHVHLQGCLMQHMQLHNECNLVSWNCQALKSSSPVTAIKKNNQQRTLGICSETEQPSIIIMLFHLVKSTKKQQCYLFTHYFWKAQITFLFTTENMWSGKSMGFYRLIVKCVFFFFFEWQRVIPNDKYLYRRIGSIQSMQT